MHLRLSPYVPRDLEEIANYIAQDSPRHALSVVRRLRAAFAEIAKQPQLYRLRPELARDARIAPIGSYLILFRIRDSTVRIERVIHGSRDLISILTNTGQ
jgi:toxin ParE1/3/4